MAEQTAHETPFVKQLASSDRPTREKALDSLRSYLTSDRNFTPLELLKLWRGLFFCMWYSDRLQTQQKLANSLAQLVNPLRTDLFVPFLTAFWTTLTTNFHMIDSLRLDKFLLLARKYINVAFSYLSQESWPTGITTAYLNLVTQILLEGQGTVGDGLRYHILEVWIDELDAADSDRKAPLETILDVVIKAKEHGRTKFLRARAQEVLTDERLGNWAAANMERSRGRSPGIGTESNRIENR